MSSADYDKAHRLAQKRYNEQVSKGAYPYLPVLDDILSHIEIVTRTNLGLIDIPIDMIVGTSTQGRTTAFAGNFMPLLEPDSEFARKWATLIDALLEEGQRDPIVALEFMNRFYVIEGNKRVSVSKFLGSASVTGTVTRLVPKKSDDPEIIKYYEFIDFYRDTKINYLWFSKLGSYNKLLKELDKEPGQVWTQDECALFRSAYLYFTKEYDALGGEKLPITKGDAMLAYIGIFGYTDLPNSTPDEIRKNLDKIWDEFLVLGEEDSISLVMDPAQAPKKGLLSKLIGPSAPQKMSAAFIHTKTAKTSSWTYGHELGRTHVEQVFDGRLTTCCIDDVDPDDQDAAFEIIEQAILDGNDIIFTTTPELITASLRSAVEHPDVYILNCSLNTSHSYIRTYYGRMYEAKFLTGAIAGALADNDKIGYIADYPIYGMTANINAFALGAKMVNPRARVYLEWSTVKDKDITETFRQMGINYISNKEMITPQHLSRQFGLYSMANDSPVNLAMPVWHWGKLYEKVIRGILSGSWDQEEATDTPQALNYWWGMSAGVIDVISSQKLPAGTQILTRILKKSISTGEFNPFCGALYDQHGILRNEDDSTMSPESIITMDWLVDNVVGTIPTIDELKDEARPIVELHGLNNNEKK